MCGKQRLGLLALVGRRDGQPAEHVAGGGGQALRAMPLARLPSPLRRACRQNAPELPSTLSLLLLAVSDSKKAK